MPGDDLPLIVSDPAVMGGRPVFRGTRVPVEVLFDNLADGLTLDEILSSYPTLDRADCKAAIQASHNPLTFAERVAQAERDGYVDWSVNAHDEQRRT